MPSHRSTTHALEVLDRRVGYEGKFRALLAEERGHAQVAREIRGLRTHRGLTQRKLAERIGTTQSVIARLEIANYEGHSLRMLRRIAEALDAHLSVSFVPVELPSEAER